MFPDSLFSVYQHRPKIHHWPFDLECRQQRKRRSLALHRSVPDTVGAMPRRHLSNLAVAVLTRQLVLFPRLWYPADPKRPARDMMMSQ